jgi:SAM-dependent methyltransferase
MKPDVYKRHIKNFSNHWWFQARKKIIEATISKNFKRKLNILDFGSGSGVNIRMLSKFGFVNIYEPHLKTTKYLKLKYQNTKKFKVLKKIGKNKFDLIILADVLEHIKYDKKELERLSGNLNKNGHILITVPAYKFLFSIKDKILGHHRRYNKNQISNLFKNFDTIKLTHFNFFLFIPISLIIIFFKILNINFIKKVESSPSFYVNKILFSIFMIEKKLIQFLDLPFGISLLGLFRKND